MTRSRLTRVAVVAARVGQLAAAAVVLQRIAKAAHQPAPLAVVAPFAPLPTITVVVPARNEIARIAPCLEALRNAPGVIEVLVIDDQSTDGTAELASALGATVITGAPLPDGWAGKCWALQQGLNEATGDWVVTLDADTRPSAHLPAAVVARARDDGDELITVAGRFDCPTPGSRWLHPAMLTTLVYRYGPPGTGAKRELANGQCMAFDRAAFVATGGFEPVKRHIVEDVALVRQRRAAGTAVGMVDGAELLTVRMFESFGDTWSGWGRSLNLPGVETRAQQALDVGVLAATQAAPLLRTVWRTARGRRPTLLDALLLLVRAGTLVGTSRAYRTTDRAYWLSPLADGPAVARLAWGVIRPSRSWRGRTYANT
jgi:dolichol-phosphate mannosyltransferase